jgi:circadian clock protein KaiC
MSTARPGEVERVNPGIDGLEHLVSGGLPASRLTLVSGTAGAGKTMFAVQFLAEGAASGEEPGVFVTFEERPEAVRQNFRSFGWDVRAWEEAGTFSFVDTSPQLDEDTPVIGDYDLSPLVVRVRHAVEQIGAKRVAIDATGALVEQFRDIGAARRALLQLSAELQDLGVTSIMTAERIEDYGPVTKFGFEEFVADAVIILRNALGDEKRRRTVEVLKLRGGSHLRGEHLFTVVAERGMVVLPQEGVHFGFSSSRRRLSSGIAELDQMCNGGLFDRSLVLVSGPTGTGKSLMASSFVAGGVREGERAMLFSFEESRDQLARNAAAWGLDFDDLEDRGLLRIHAVAPESESLEDHLLRMQSAMTEFEPERVAIDSLTALQRVTTAKSFREYLLGLSFHIKTRALLGMVTATAEGLTGELTSGALHVSTVSDTVILLQYVGAADRISRGITVLKMRGSDHDKAIREFRIDDHGMHIGQPLALAAWPQLPQSI